jgi:hypothetical protein
MLAATLLGDKEYYLGELVENTSLGRSYHGRMASASTHVCLTLG